MTWKVTKAGKAVVAEKPVAGRGSKTGAAGA